MTPCSPYTFSVLSTCPLGIPTIYFPNAPPLPQPPSFSPLRHWVSVHGRRTMHEFAKVSHRICL